MKKENQNEDKSEQRNLSRSGQINNEQKHKTTKGNNVLLKAVDPLIHSTASGSEATCSTCTSCSRRDTITAGLQQAGDSYHIVTSQEYACLYVRVSHRAIFHCSIRVLKPQRVVLVMTCSYYC